MRTVRKTFVTLFVTAFSVAFALLLTVLVAAACSDRITLRFETGGGTHIASVEGSAGGTYRKPADPEKEGYFFDGWYLDPDCTGESLSLPDVLPETSTTYYAKYVRCPLLSLDAEGGELPETEHHIRPGTDLLRYLSDYVPQKEGLVFGGWECGGTLLSDGAEMTEEDMSLTARYKAEYEVRVLLQSADEPTKYEKSDGLSYTGADWLGAQFSAEIPTPEHFLFLPASSVCVGELHAGVNLFELRYAREELELSYSMQDPNGRQEEGTIKSRYGAHVALPEPDPLQGYFFFGWSDGENEYEGGASVTLERPLVLTGTWGKLYPNVRGEGALAVETEESPVRRADYLLGGKRHTGEYREGFFSAGDFRGKLVKGGILLDDSGTYLGEDLAANAAGEEYGVLTLDFFKGTALLRTAETEMSGVYEYAYDEEAEEYSGDYLFSAGEANFRFVLGEGTFLRQGKEKNSYAQYSVETGGFLSDALVFDGYGRGIWKKGEISSAGSYRGGGRSGEWEFFPEQGDSFRVLLGKRVWTDGGLFAGEQAFLYFDPSLAGEYRAEGSSLLLDGYGLKAVYRAGEREVFAPFTREGNVVTLHAETPLRFTLKGDAFLPAGEECGTYGGALGTLVLDGAGGALLKKGGAILAEGEYRPEGSDWLFSGGQKFQFRLDGENYLVYHEELGGEYFVESGQTLLLDGYGGGKYRNMFGGETDVTLLYADESLLVLSAPSMTTAYRCFALSVTDLAEKRCRENPSMTAGAFPVLVGGKTRGMLVLDGAGGAVYAEENAVRGTYVLSDGLAECLFGGTRTQFRIEEEDGSFFCLAADVSGEFTDGEGTLSLDGFGKAVYRGGESFTAPYRAEGRTAEIVRGGEVWRFVLSEDKFTLTRYRRYLSPDGKGELLLAIGGGGALYRDGREYVGAYSKEQIFVSEELEFSYRIYGDVFRFYDRTQEISYRAGEGTLRLDGCGLGEYTVGETVYRGSVTVTDVGLIVFSSEELPALSGMAGFRIGANGALEVLGEEFGVYAPRGGEGELFLQGDGVAYLRKGGIWRAGVYTRTESGEFLFGLYGESFRFRTEKYGGGAAYAVFREELSAYAGEYTTEEGLLVVDGYGATLGERELCFVCAGTEGFVAFEEETQTYYAVRIGEETTIRAAERFYTA